MITGVFVFLAILLMFVMLTLGSVLLGKFLFGKLPRVWRVMIASCAGPTLILLPSMIADTFMANGSASFGVLSISLIFVVLIGWPIAFFSTKKLDAMTAFETETFR